MQEDDSIAAKRAFDGVLGTTRWPIAIVFVVLGFMYAAVMSGIGFGLCGGGHGWSGALELGVYCMAFLPMAGAGIAYLGRIVARVLIWPAALFAGWFDLQIVPALIKGGSIYFEKVRQAVPEAFYLWTGLWFGWQVVIALVILLDIAILARQIRRRST